MYICRVGREREWVTNSMGEGDARYPLEFILLEIELLQGGQRSYTTKWILEQNGAGPKPFGSEVETNGSKTVLSSTIQAELQSQA